jgi:adenine phosphoribosyltransferase
LEIDGEPVTFEMVLQTMKNNAEKVKRLLLKIIPELNSLLQNSIEQPKVAVVKEESPEEKLIKSKIRTVPNWPKPGIMFRDITTLLKDPEGLKKTVEVLEKRYKDMEIDSIAGIESRGFIVASVLAHKLNKSLILIRKPGKLPAETVSEEYELEYGTDKIEIHRDAIDIGDKVLLVDDLIATGGTCAAAGKLIERLGGNVVECAFIVELPELKGREKIKWPIYKIVDFEGE